MWWTPSQTHLRGKKKSSKPNRENGIWEALLTGIVKMLRTMLSDLQRFRVERCWDHHIDTLSIKNFKVIKIEISDRDEHGRVIPNGRASRSTRSVRTTIALSFNLNLTLLWYKCRPSSDEKHQDDGPECVSTCWHGQCTHLVMTTLRKVLDFVYFLPFLFALYHHPESPGTFYPDPHASVMTHTLDHPSMT